MLKTLKIASFLAVAAAIAVVGAVAYYGMKADEQVLAFLNRENVIEKYRKDAKGETNPIDKNSPLVEQARLFALRIDPPPPPPKPTPPKPPVNKKPAVTVKKPETRKSVVPPAPPVKRPVNSNFTLLATAQYKEKPERSLIMIKDHLQKTRWLRQGEVIGHLTIHEVKDGSVVMFQNNKFHSEPQVQAKPQIRSLLKNEGTASSATDARVSSTIPGSTNPTTSVSTQNQGTSSKGIPATNQKFRPTLSQRRTTSSVTPAIRRPAKRPAPVQQTPKQQIETIDESIKGIQEILLASQAHYEDRSEEEIQQEKEAFNGLIEMLKKEKQMLAEMEKQSSNTKTGKTATENKESIKTAPAFKKDENRESD